jgi:hypothetical protein
MAKINLGVASGGVSSNIEAKKINVYQWRRRSWRKASASIG